MGKGVPSDHCTPFAEPIIDWSKSSRKKYKTVNIRRMPHSGIQKFGQWIVKENFEEVYNAVSSTEKVMALQSLISNKVEEIFPTKKFKIFDKLSVG